jgi:hypothetical protein
MISLILAVLCLLSIGVYYVTRKLHREDNSISNHQTLRIMTSIVYGLYILFLFSVLNEYKTKSCKSLCFLFILIIAAQMLLILLREFNVMQIDHRNKVILNNTLTASIVIEFIISFLCLAKITIIK